MLDFAEIIYHVLLREVVVRRARTPPCLRPREVCVGLDRGQGGDFGVVREAENFQTSGTFKGTADGRRVGELLRRGEVAGHGGGKSNLGKPKVNEIALSYDQTARKPMH